MYLAIKKVTTETTGNTIIIIPFLNIALFK